MLLRKDIPDLPREVNVNLLWARYDIIMHYDKTTQIIKAQIIVIQCSQKHISCTHLSILIYVSHTNIQYKLDYIINELSFIYGKRIEINMCLEILQC